MRISDELKQAVRVQSYFLPYRLFLSLTQPGNYGKYFWTTSQPVSDTQTNPRNKMIFVPI